MTTNGTAPTRRTPDAGPEPSRRVWWRSLVDPVVRGVSVFGLALAGIVPLVLALVSTALVAIGVGALLLPYAHALVRAHANLLRWLCGRWFGVSIDAPYRPVEPVSGGWVGGSFRRTARLLRDPASWRDVLWLFYNVPVGGVLGLAAAVPVASGVEGMLMPLLWRLVDDGPGGSAAYWYLFVPVTTDTRAYIALGIGLLLLLAAPTVGGALLRGYARASRWLLAPTREAELTTRVAHLTQTRHDAVDTRAAELRRIERDLHDGAQARLVAMGMTLGAAEHLLESNPQAARALLNEAREASSKALQELRDLVRGIHPPVLADRGLADAVRALGLESPLRVEVVAELSGRLDPPVESAAYFAVSEILTNAAKHSGASRVWIDLRWESERAGARTGPGRLRVDVTDDGCGGADPSRGTGLRGIERRLGTFDGVLALNSPQGGPTLVTMELPCVLSSPKTSSS
ncbi:sensor histidine kinase [Allostreptomyces psammosilenae]|uniref:histidine kinase n=1 Tax=Allostreptomyces psammosilenae TaxID=1892865 RepID=A0A852ZZ76_9ACTN|nr:sensor histidine kinase [Allostreptomyces psammosilenae]NYI07683.1 signal transduction histidine kinase [Allostreptomyces psammosilenae]